MSADDLVRRYVDAINRGDLQGLAAMFAPNAVLYEPLAPEPVKGRDAIAATFAAFKQAIPDMQWRLIAPVFDDGQRVAFEVDVAGVNSGTLPTPEGELPPTGNAVSLRIAVVETLDADGLIAEERAYFDATGLAAQLGMTG
ncbi:MAG TPA: nuclear transport factor 2 family protein [Actinomycetota bacterium]|nr:nuclear transport factor 2 family protein [Actinomycetota bacterium]